MLIIGSTALNVYTRVRTPADLDLMCTELEMAGFCLAQGFRAIDDLGFGHYVVHDAPGFKHIEFHVAEKSDAVRAYLNVPNIYDTEYLSIYGQRIPVASLDVLYSLKRSHRFLARHWQKHIYDYHLLKDLRGAEPDAVPRITAMKQAETAHKHTPSLNRSKSEFFDDDVSNHTFEHDQMHEIMAHRERPMFEYIADSSSGTVKSSKAKFERLAFDDQVRCVLEEAYVIALERGVIPMLYEGKKLADSESALRWSLMRICTTLTGGWFREFAVENYPAIWSRRDPGYAEKFLKAVDSGKIKQIERKGENVTN